MRLKKAENKIGGMMLEREFICNGKIWKFAENVKQLGYYHFLVHFKSTRPKQSALSKELLSPNLGVNYQQRWSAESSENAPNSADYIQNVTSFRDPVS